MARIVGAVGLKVKPDTSRFKREADAELKAVELKEVKAPLSPDGDRLHRETDRVIKEESRRLKSEGAGIAVPVKADDRGLITQAKRAARDASRAIKSAGVNLKIPLGIDTSKVVKDIEDGLDKALAKIREHGALEVAVKIGVDTTRANDDLDDFVRHNNGRNIDLDVGLDSNAAIHGQLAALARDRRVTVTPTLNQRAYASVLASLGALSGLNVVRDFSRFLRDTAKNADRFAISAAKIGVAIGSIATVGFAGFGGISVVAGGLAQIGGAALALPSALTAIASFAVIGGAAFKNFGDAVKGNADALSQLPANAQKAAQALQGTWTQIQRPVQASFWDGVGASFERSVGPIIDKLESGLSRVGTQAGRALGNTLSGVRDIAESGLLDRMFTGLATGLKNANGGIAPFMRALGTLSTEASDKLPEVGSYLADIGQRFERWVNAAAATGRMDTWLSNAFKRLGQIRDIFKDLVGGFSAINDAARRAGFDGMDALTERLAGFRKTLESFPAQTALTTLFKGAKDAMDEFKPGLATLGTSVANLAPVLAGLMRSSGDILATISRTVAGVFDNPTFRSGISSFFTNISDGLRVLEKAAPMIGTIFGTLLSSAGEVFKNLSPAFGTGLGIIADAFARLAPAMASLSQALGGALQTGLSVLSTLLPPLATVAASFAAAIALIPSPLLATATAMLLLSKALGGALLSKLGGLLTSMTTLGAGGVAARAGAGLKNLWTNLGGFKGIAAGVGIAALVSGLSEMSAISQQVAQNTQAAFEAAQRLAKVRIENPLSTGRTKEELDTANAQAQSLLDTMGRVAEVPAAVKGELGNNRQGLIDLYLGDPTEAAAKAKQMLSIAKTFTSAANSGVGDFFKEAFSFGGANTNDRNVLEGQLNDYVNAAGQITDIQKGLESTDNGKVQKNLAVMAGAIVKFGQVTPAALDSAQVAITDFTGKPLKGIEAFATGIASNLSGSKDEIHKYAVGLADGMRELGTSPEALVQIATRMGLPASTIEKLLSSIGRSSEQAAQDMKFGFGAVTDTIGNIVTVAGSAVPKLTPFSDGLSELGDSVSALTEIDSSTLTHVFRTMGTDALSVAQGLTAAGVSVSDISKVLAAMDKPASDAAGALNAVTQAQQRMAKENIASGGGWNTIAATTYSKALQEIGKSADGAAQKADALRQAIDQLNGGQLSSEQATADLNASVDNAASAISGLGGQVVQADGSIKKIAARAADFGKVMDLTTGQIDTTSEAGRNLFGAITDLSSKALTSAQTEFDRIYKSTGDYALAADAATKATQGQADSLRKLLTDAGLTTDQVDALLARYNLFPDKITTDLIAETAAATNPIGGVLGLLNNFENPRKVKLGALPEGADKVLEGLGIKLTRFADGTYEANLGATDDEARGKVAELAAWVTGQTFSGVVDFSSYVNSMGPIEIGVTARFDRTKGTAVANGGIFDMIAPGRLVKAFASGGVERHVAQIAKPTMQTPIRIWAEPETHGEAYIPLALSKRDRSTEILRQVASEFGMQLIGSQPQAKRFADGGITGAAGPAVFGNGPTFHVTNNYPQAEPTSVTVARAGALVGALGEY